MGMPLFVNLSPASKVRRQLFPLESGNFASLRDLIDGNLETSRIFSS
jgi:hypothetical protein